MASSEFTYGDSLGFSQLSTQQLSSQQQLPSQQQLTSQQQLPSQQNIMSKLEELPLPPPPSSQLSSAQLPARHHQLLQAAQSAEVLPQPQHLLQPEQQQQKQQRLPYKQQQLIQPQRFKNVHQHGLHKRLETTQPPILEVDGGFRGSEERRGQPQPFQLGMTMSMDPVSIKLLFDVVYIWTTQLWQFTSKHSMKGSSRQSKSENRGVQKKC
jgi:hypothetical protein